MLLALMGMHVLAAEMPRAANESVAQHKPISLEVTQTEKNPSVAREKATKKVTEALRSLRHEEFGELKVDFVFSNLNLRHEWRFRFKGGIASVCAETGDLVMLSMMRNDFTEIPIDKSRKNAISEEKARKCATVFLEKVCGPETARFMTTSKCVYEDIADMRKGDLAGALWTLIKPQAHKGVECYDSAVAVSVRAFDGKIMSYSRGYSPLLVASTTPLTKREEAIGIAAKAIAKEARVVAARMVILNPSMHGLPAENQRPSLFWVLDYTLGKRPARRNIFVDAMRGNVYVK